MKPVHQTIFFEPGRNERDQRGNCLTAVVASLLELPIEAVPNFVEIDVAGGPDWWQLLWRYLDLMGYELRNVSVRNPPDGYYTVSGLSPRASETHAIYHICVYRAGRLVHDPHPDGAGLWTEEDSWHAVKVRDVIKFT